MAAGTLTVQGMSASEPAGQRTFGPLTITGTQVIGETLEAPLASGDNTFAVPTAAVACLIIPPTNGTAVLKLRTSANSSDAGLPLNGGGAPTLYPFPASAPTSLIVNASVSQTPPLTIAFI